ncbi:MAG: hypothetical protein AB7E59_14085 [Pusillimonas sp.]
MAKIAAVGLAGIGVVEFAFRGTDAALYAWYLLFVLWMVALFIHFALAVVDAYKTVLARGPDGEMTFPEFEKKMASSSRDSDEKASGASSKATSGNGNDGGTEAFPDDDRTNQLYRANDPFGEFLDS